MTKVYTNLRMLLSELWLRSNKNDQTVVENDQIFENYYDLNEIIIEGWHKERNEQLKTNDNLVHNF